MTNTTEPTAQRATLPDCRISNARNLDTEKETIGRRVALAVFIQSDGEPRAHVVADARWYMSRSADGASPVWCSVWVTPYGHRDPCSGHGKARGYGYDKRSAALQAALDSAGVTLAVHIDGVGPSAVDDALRAITLAAAPEGASVVLV